MQPGYEKILHAHAVFQADSSEQVIQSEKVGQVKALPAKTCTIHSTSVYERVTTLYSNYPLLVYSLLRWNMTCNAQIHNFR